jgi:hypothetical protein
VLGLLLAAWMTSLVGGIKLPMDIALVFSRLDWRVMFFALGLSILTGLFSAFCLRSIFQAGTGSQFER